MDEEQMQGAIEDSLIDYFEDYDFKIKTFEEAGVLTKNKGLVVSFNDEKKASFQITIVQTN